MEKGKELLVRDSDAKERRVRNGSECMRDGYAVSLYGMLFLFRPLSVLLLPPGLASFPPYGPSLRRWIRPRI